MNIAEYKKIVVSLRPTLIAVSRRITKNAEDAEDVVQEVCLKIWHRREQFEQYRNIEAYGTTMAKNLSIDIIRAKRPRVNEDFLLNVQTDERQLPDSILEEKDVGDAIRKMIALLPPLQQHILQMKEIEGYDTGEIVEITGISAEAVHNNLSRARKRLKELFSLYYTTKQISK
jgi:RNA polymerase sigma-70 factor (ECF subfamily)